MFSWIPIHEETAKRLLEFVGRSKELAALVHRMHDKGLKALPAQDKDEEGKTIPLADIDPFTFLAGLNRGVRNDNRKALWQFLKDEWKLAAPVPEDFDGLPLANLQNSWMFPYEKDREADHLPLLWEFYRHIMDVEPSGLNAVLMDRCLSKPGVGLAFLTMGMFWACPRKWIATDGKNLGFAKTKGVTKKIKTAADYIEWLPKIRSVIGGDGVEFSRQAHLWSVSKSPWWQRYFDSEDQAHAVFDLIRDACLALGVSDSRGESAQRVSFTYIKEKGREWLRLNCANILVLQIGAAAPGMTNASFIMRANEQQGEFLPKGRFAKPCNGHAMGFCSTQLASLLGANSIARNLLLNALGDVAATYSKITKRNFQNAHRPRLLAAVFHPEKRDDVFENGPTRGAVELNYWSIIANPEGFGSPKVDPGHKELFKALDENGQPREKEAAFEEVAEGDPVLVFSSSPQWSILAIGNVSKSMAATNGLGVEIEFETFFSEPIQVESLMHSPGISEMLPPNHPEGTLFPLTEAEFSAIREATPDPLPVIVQPRLVYTVSHAMADLFMDESKLLSIVALLKRKKNIILQGAPGTGKTFVARRLAYLLMGVKDERRAPITQFHQSTSYEDFIQGYRPDGNGGFQLKDGIFHAFCLKALKAKDDPHVFIIDEINRGNIAKILGELMMLIEPDKRSPDFAVPLTYAKSQGETFHVPPNVYLIGTMNTADRSLSLVDYALRRRFAFIEAEPGFDSPGFHEYLEKAGAGKSLIDSIVGKMNQLNALIAEDVGNLGRGYRIGHSFFVPAPEITPDEAWLEDVLQHEIRPLLEEYWVDNDKALQKAREILR